MRVVRFVALVLSVFVASDAAFAQALPNLSSVRVGYNTRKATVKPEGELKAQIDEIDQQIAEATRLGRFGDVRRLYAKGTTLLAGRPWTDAAEFQAALVIRTDRVLVDSSAPYRVRLEQIFAPAIELSQLLTAHATIRPRATALPDPDARATSPGSAASAAPAPPTPIDLGTFDGVSRDLRESPFPIDLDVAAIADGPYTLSIEVRDQDRSLGTATLNVALMKGLDARLRALDAAAAKAPATVQASLRYPGDYIRKINHGTIGFGTFDLTADLAAAEALAASVAKSKRDPFVGRTGDFERHYLLEGANEIMPYRVYVPTSYTGTKPFPLIIALHGLGGTEDGMLDRYGRRIPTLAEERGYIVASPLGFRVDGFYGSGVVATADPRERRNREFSEKDVMEVLNRMRADYTIDESRIYLMGHSMGAIGTWALAAKYPDLWAALAPFAGMGAPATVERMRHIPQFVVHGDADPTVPVNGSRTMVEAMKKLGVRVTYIEVPGGNHSDVVVPNIPGMFDFFDAHKKSVNTSHQ
jgi:poly(3-hydroxybutyrate) depolymerase